MEKRIDYKKVFENLVTATETYLIKNKLKSMVLGISGGIDSTVCAAICHEVSKRTGIPLIGRSLPSIFNKEEEISAAQLVGINFCTKFKEVPIKSILDNFSTLLEDVEPSMTVVARGNLQARIRMIYLYHLASINKGLVIDTDNLTENNLGYFTIHGDEGDFSPIGCLWKTEVFKLAEWLFNKYDEEARKTGAYYNNESTVVPKMKAIKESLKLKPTAGLGITDSDLDEIGAESYDQVDGILQEILAWKRLSIDHRGDVYSTTKKMRDAFLDEQVMYYYPIEVIIKVTDRHFNSEFKRKQLPIKLKRDSIL